MQREPKDRPMVIGGLDEPLDADEAARIKALTKRAGARVAGERSDVPTLQHRNGTVSRPRTRRTDGEPMRMTSVHLPTALIVQVNVEAAQRQTTFSAIVEEALVAHTARRAG